MAFSATVYGAAPKFGFSGPEIFPVDSRVHGLKAADLDADGRMDLLVVNNARSQLRLLYNRSPKEIAQAASQGPKPDVGRNQLPPDARFEIDDLIMESRVGGFVLGDFSGNSLPDLVVVDDGGKLRLTINDGARRWKEPVEWETAVAQSSMNGIAKGDFNGDRRADVALLGDGFVELWLQRTNGGFGEAMKIPYAGQPRAVQAVDANADGLDDLILVEWDSERPLRIRLQDAAGSLGPETQVESSRFRAMETADLDGDGKLELLTIAQTSGRAHVARLRPAVSIKGFVGSTLRLLPLPRASAARRGVLWEDLDGDGRGDLIYSQSDQGLLSVRSWSGATRDFPSLTGIAQIERADWDGDGVVELFVFSPEEKQVGVIRPGEGGRLAFPNLFALKGKPLAMAVGRFKKEEPMTVAVLEDEDGKRGVFLRTSDGPGRRFSLPKDFRVNPAAMFFHDADQDGEADLVCLTPYEKVAVLRREKTGAFKVQDVFPPGGAVARPAYGVADLDGDGNDELLLPQRNFVRAVVLEVGGGTATFRVKEQINGEAGDSRIVAMIPAGDSRRGARRLHLLDAARNRWTEVERNRDGVWTVRHSLELPANDFDAMESVRLNGPALVFSGPNTVGWMAEGDAGWELKRGADYDSEIENGRLTDVKIGDLNADGRPEALFLETARNHLEIATTTGDGGLKPAVWWKVFEQRTFRNPGAAMPEPREAVIADFTGDGKNDIAILVHDRVLLYPQQ